MSVTLEEVQLAQEIYGLSGTYSVLLTDLLLACSSFLRYHMAYQHHMEAIWRIQNN